MTTRGPHGQRFEAHRPVVMGRNGMVCSGHPLASEAGIATLRRGGDAVDAAVAVAAALNVVEPAMSGVGGDGFVMLCRRGGPNADPALGGTVEVVNATGAAPLAATRGAYRDGIPAKGIRSASTPGLEECFGPAIGLAEDGFPISHRLAAQIAADHRLLEFPSSRAIFAPDGRPPRAGQVLHQRDLAGTFRTIARGGRAAFYEGPIARAIVAASERAGGLLTLEDFRRCRARWQPPIATDYRGHRVLETPPNSSGHVLLQELNVVERFDLAAMGALSADAIHVMVEAKRLAFADRERYMADPDWVDVPIEGLLSKAYAAERARLIDPARAIAAVEAPRWRHAGKGTESAVPHGTEDRLRMEARFPEDVREDLRRRGHPVDVLGDWEGQGNEVAILVDRENGALQGACDPRRDGYAIGY